METIVFLVFVIILVAIFVAPFAWKTYQEEKTSRTALQNGYEQVQIMAFNEAGESYTDFVWEKKSNENL